MNKLKMLALISAFVLSTLACKVVDEGFQPVHDNTDFNPAWEALP